MFNFDLQLFAHKKVLVALVTVVTVNPNVLALKNTLVQSLQQAAF